MAVELEAKIKVAEHESYRQRLRDAGAKPIGDFREVNTFFDMPDGSLLAGDRGLRVRINREVTTGKTEAILTYKGARQPGPLKNREEHETTLGDAESFVRIITAIGFRQTLSFEKNRQSWKLGDCKVELDELPHLGLYLEVEGPSETAIRETQKKIGAEGPLVREGYAGMLTTWLAERGSRGRVVVFEK